MKSRLKITLIIATILSGCDKQPPRQHPARVIRFEDLKQIQPGDYSTLRGDDGKPHSY